MVRMCIRAHLQVGVHIMDILPLCMVGGAVVKPVADCDKRRAIEASTSGGPVDVAEVENPQDMSRGEPPEVSAACVEGCRGRRDTEERLLTAQ